VVTDYSPLVLDCDRQIEFETAAPSIFVRGNRRPTAPATFRR
jgi:hypothetical protein